MTTVAEMIVDSLADHGVKQIWGVVGDALNPITDAIRKDGRMEWIGVRHEEAAAFAVSAQAQLTGTIGVAMGTVGPGAIHLLNGLYDAKKSGAPVLAIVGQVPSVSMGTEFFQEVNNNRLFDDVATWTHTMTNGEHAAQLMEQAVNAAYANSGVSVLSIPADIGGLELPRHASQPRFAPPYEPGAARMSCIDQAVAMLKDKKVTIMGGIGASRARAEVLQLAETLKAPIMVTLKGKEVFDGEDNPYNVGQSGLIGNDAAANALEEADVLFMIGTDFPYVDWYPTGKQVIQLDINHAHIGRRIGVDVALVGDAKDTLEVLLPKLSPSNDDAHLKKAIKAYDSWHQGQQRLAQPDYDKTLIGRVRDTFENPDDRIRPEVLTNIINDLADDDAVFTMDTGMSTTWASRFINVHSNRRFLGSLNLGSMANALPQALGAQALDRNRQVFALAGDGGLMMLLGDLRTAVSYDLPITFVVYNNERLGMVKLEQEQVGLLEFGTELDNPNIAEVASSLGLASRRVEKTEDIEDAVRWAMNHQGPALLDMVTNAGAVSVPPNPTVSQGWGYAKAKSKEAWKQFADR